MPGNLFQTTGYKVADATGRTLKPKLTIAADAPLTAHAGAEIAQAGGNAVDVAIAAALAAMISEVLMCSLGGSGFIMVRDPDGQPELTDGADAMPARCDDPQFREVSLAYGDGITVRCGYGTVAVPGCLAALELAWKRHGSLPWKDIVAPALGIAARPVPAGPTLGKWLAMAGKAVFYEQTASRECFFPDDNALVENQEFIIPHMTDTLDQIAREGADALYRGDLGRLFAEAMKTNGGCVSREDLASYEAAIREPLIIDSAGFTLATNPLPSVGGTGLGHMIRFVEERWRAGLSPAEKNLVIAEAQHSMLNLRNVGMQSPNTTHLSVTTSDGAAVSVTMSNGYGSGINIPGTGITCNNSLGEPELNPGGYYNAPAGSRLTSNMSPTIATHPDGRTVALGSPGASRITTAILQTWIQYAFANQNLKDAVEHPRLHIEEWPDGMRALCEPGLDTSALSETFRVRAFEEKDMFFGAIKVCARDNAGNLIAVSDSRRHGSVRMIP